MQLTKIHISNFRGLSNFKHTTSGKPVLVHGDNGVGKTSLCRALQIALAGKTIPQKQAKMSAHCGAAAGYHINVEVAGDSVAATPTSVACSSGEHDDAVAVGFAKLSGLKPKERLAHFITICGLSALDDAEQYFNTMPGGGDVKEDFNQRAERHKQDGDIPDWDEFGSAYEGALRNAKRKWESITGDRYGSVKSANWRPENLPLTENRTTAELEVALEEARHNASRSAGHMEALRQAVEGHKADIEKWQTESSHEAEIMLHDFDLSDSQEAGLEFVGGDPELESVNKILHTNLMERSGELNRLQEAKKRVKMVCPACEADLVVSARDKTKLVLAMSDINPERLDPQIKKVEEEVEDLQRKIDAYTRIKNYTSQEEHANKRIAEIEVELQADVITSTATENIDTLQLYLQQSKRIDQATVAMDECRRLTLLKEACSPTGIRKYAADKALADVQQAVNDITTALDFPATVTLHENGEVSVYRTKYATDLDYASESERWMADVVYQAAAAQLTAARCVIIDSADILSPEQTAVSFKALTQINGGSVIIAATGGDAKFAGQTTDDVECIQLSE